MGTQNQPSGAIPTQLKQPFLLIPDTLEIENRQGYPSSVVAELRHLLTALPGSLEVSVRPDPLRLGCYDLECQGRVFFVYVSRSRRQVSLLATWQEEA